MVIGPAAGLRELWKRYQAQLLRRPVRTQVISSGLLWAVGDVIAQIVETKIENRHGSFDLAQSNPNSFESGSTSVDRGTASDGLDWRLDLPRVAKTSLFGFGFVGPEGHFWYSGLEHFVTKQMKLRPNSGRFVGTKVLVDTLLFGPIDLLAFFTYMGLASGKSLPEVGNEMRRIFHLRL